MVGSEELEMSSWCTCVAVSFFHFKKGETEENMIVVEERSSLQSVVLAVQGYSA